MDFNAMLAGIPYLVPHCLSVTEEGDGFVKVRMPFGKPLTNYLGMWHASAFFTVAETAAGLQAFRIVPGNRAIILLRKANVHYTKPAKGDLTATARVKDDQSKKTRADFDSEGRADSLVDVEVVDSEDQIVFRGTFDYALRPGSL